MRNPKWHRDEIILALDLYFRTEPGRIHAKNPEIIELSDILNRLPIHEIRSDSGKFRNPNGVGLKLSNFLAIDPNYNGKGMASYSNLDCEVFMEFVNERQRLSELASRLKKILDNPNLNNELYKIENDEDQIVKEGLVIYKLHKLRERNSAINKKKKEKYLKENGKLQCEVCGFDFYKFYGELGYGFIECHHRIPLFTINGETLTRLEDLGLVCANCHRMLHREIDSLSIDELKKRINR